jgi:hypothetical protein
MQTDPPSISEPSVASPTTANETQRQPVGSRQQKKMERKRQVNASMT